MDAVYLCVYGSEPGEWACFYVASTLEKAKRACETEAGAHHGETVCWVPAGDDDELLVMQFKEADISIVRMPIDK